MPLLKQVLPDCFSDKADQNMSAAALLDVPVKAVKLATGSPCSSHAEMFEEWPGGHANVRQWFILENGKAVAVVESPESDWSFPVVDYQV